MDNEKLFQPKIGRGPKPVKNSDKPKINYGFIKTEWRKILKIPGNNDKNFSNAKSQDILANAKKRRFREIFDMLSPNNEVLNANEIDLEKVPKTLLAILSPLLEEIAELVEGIGFNDFYQALENLYTSLSVGEKSILISTGCKRVMSQSEFTFKPVINHFNNKLQESVVERSERLWTERKKKIEVVQNDLSMREMKQCTFSPVTTKFPGKKMYSSCWVRYHSP